ncbi:hypothetical protein Ahy_Scaffold8g108517 [Arachis hypogaea]|uniref:F-box associated beta-propeller type 1 domain-containing protein n=1 Tax=Arachis hypogaea TaxID=3818 RepID=A0A444WPA6_ARAHY|nr:hypothetical protein Ahy_Scaffold8g108517 [Arachis hypogaea]
MNCEKLSNPSMDKKKKLKHTVNKAKEQSSMENKKKNDKNKSIHDILPLDLIHIIFLRVPIRHLARLRIAYNAYLHGFGYDASQDDYLLLVAWCDCELQYHLDCFSLRTNSWINHDAAVPKHLGIQILGFRSWHSGGLFFNGAVHWVPWDLKDYRDAIIIFDLMEMTFSTISAPEQMSGSYTSLALLRGCLALYSCNNDSCNTDIWVMKEYKVHSSWTLYQIPCKYFRPLCLSSNRDIIGRGYTSCGKIGYFIYNVRGDLLKHFKNLRCQLHCRELNIVYTESLLPLPSDIKDKDNKKMKKEIGM